MADTEIPTAVRTFAATVSTGARILRDGSRPDGSWGPWQEQLDVTGADLSRLAGAPLLLDHLARTDFVAGVVEAAKVERGTIVADLRFGTDPRARQLAADVRDRIRRQLSVGYSVSEWQRAGSSKADAVPTFTATKWTPLEISIVALGADAGATFRSDNPAIRTRSMTATASAPEAAPVIITNPPAADPALAGVETERQRTAGILRTAELLNLPASHARALISEGVSLDTARARLIDLNHEAAQSTRIDSTGRVTGGRDHTDPAEIVERMSGWLAHRLSGGRTALPDASRQYAGASLLDLGRALLQARGGRQWLASADIAGELLGRGSSGYHTTSDFALLMGSGANRALLDRFAQLAPALLPIARRVQVPDFRAIQRIRLGEGSDLSQVNEHGEITRGTVGETGESYSIATFAKIFAFTRKLIVNNDLGALQDFIAAIGGKAAVLLGNILFDTLNNNALMADGINFFHSTHNNLAGTPATIDATSLDIARKAMRNQTGVDGGRVNVAPKYLIVGPAKETAAETMLATLAPTSTGDVNVFAGKLELIVESRITGNAWYLAADPSMMHGLEYAELDGSRSMGGSGPVVETREGWDIEGLEIKCRYDVGAGAVAYQPLFKNAGA